MKKKFKDTKVGKFLNKKGFKAIGDLAKGALLDPIKLGAMPVVGAAIGLLKGGQEAASETKKSNLESENGGYGKPNYYRYAGLAIFVLLGVSYILGWIDQTTFEVLFNRLTELSSQ